MWMIGAEVTMDEREDNSQSYVAQSKIQYIYKILDQYILAFSHVFMYGYSSYIHIRVYSREIRVNYGLLVYRKFSSLIDAHHHRGCCNM